MSVAVLHQPVTLAPEFFPASTAQSWAGVRVGIVGINYAPELTGIGPYTTGLSEHLYALGAEVHVLTGMPHYPEWTVADGDRWSSRREEDVRGVQVHRIRSFIPRRHSALTRALYEASFLAAGRRAVVPPVDLVVGITPSLSGAALALEWAERCGVRCALVVQDLVGLAASQSGMAGGRSAKAARRLEQRLLHRAHQLLVVSDGFVPPLERAGVDRSRIALTPNWSRVPMGWEKARLDRQEARQLMGWHDRQTIVLHTGNMGFKQGLETVVEAAQVTSDDSIMFVLVGDGNQRDHIAQRSAGLGNVVMLPLLPDEMYSSVLDAADILLVNERPSVKDMSLPSKLTSYFASSTPVLAAAAEGGATSREIDRSGGALLVTPGSPAALLEGIARLQADVLLRARLVQRAQAHLTDQLSAGVSLARYEAALATLID